MLLYVISVLKQSSSSCFVLPSVCLRNLWVSEIIVSPLFTDLIFPGGNSLKTEVIIWGLVVFEEQEKSRMVQIISSFFIYCPFESSILSTDRSFVSSIQNPGEPSFPITSPGFRSMVPFILFIECVWL